jgi:hypothetical protein
MPCGQRRGCQILSRFGIDTILYMCVISEQTVSVIQLTPSALASGPALADGLEVAQANGVGAARGVVKERTESDGGVGVARGIAKERTDSAQRCFGCP